MNRKTHKLPEWKEGVLVKPVSGSDLGKCMSLLQTIVEHADKARIFTQEFYPVGVGTHYIDGHPQLESPEVQLLISIGAVVYCNNVRSGPDFPEDSLRLRPKGREIIRKYVDKMTTENAFKLLNT